jgi:CHASE1-domain containing sensor protein
MVAGPPQSGRAIGSEIVPRERPLAVLIPIVAFVLVMSMTVFAASYVRSLEERSHQAAFESASRDRTAAVRNGFETSQAIVESIGSFFDASTEVRDEHFDVLARSLLQGRTSLSGLSWVPRFKAENRERHEAEAQERRPGYRITERQRQGEMVRRGSADEYFPVRYIVPLETNEAAVAASTLGRTRCG